MKKKKKNQGIVPIMIIFIIIGAAIGFVMARYTDKLESAGAGFAPALIAILIWFYLAYFIELIIHEAGHMIMGMLTGYEFLSFRVGSFTIVKENGRMTRKKFSIPGTAGQCILAPKESESPENEPFFWYHFGGILFNLLTGAAALIPAVLSDNVHITAAAAVFSADAFMIAFMNGVPLKIGGMPNDGRNIMMMMKNPAARTAVYKNFLTNAKVYRGERMENIPELVFGTEEERKTEHGTALTLMEGTYYLYTRQFERAEKIFQSATEEEHTIQVYYMEAKCELLFCMVMRGAEQEDIAAIYDKELQKYIKATGKVMITRKRLMYAYYLLAEKSSEKARAEYEAALKMEKTYPAKGEYLSDMNLINYIKSENEA